MPHKHFIPIRAVDDKMMMYAVISVHTLHYIDVSKRHCSDAPCLADFTKVGRCIFSRRLIVRWKVLTIIGERHKPVLRTEVCI